MSDGAATRFTADDVETALQTLDANLTRQLETYLQVCAHCGLCTDSCHYYLALEDPTVSPTYKADRLRNVWKREYDWLGRAVPWWVGATKLDEERLEEIATVAFRDCSMCARCLYNCPFGVDTRAIIKTMRAMVSATGKGPEILQQLADAAIAREEHLDVFKDFYLEQIATVERQLQDESGDPSARIPIEEAGAEILYVPLSGVHTMLPAARIFHRAGASWTMSLFEAANYGVFLADGSRAKRITARLVEEAKRLGVSQVVITECGHAFSTLKYTAQSWFEEEFPFEVRSIVEVIHDYVAAGTIRLEPMDVGPVTLHDSCNLGRNSGLFDEPRAVIEAAVTDFRDMVPNREQSFCCGGGGGLVANPDYSDRRLAAGKPKADSIRATGAGIVVASCDNCRHQINELSTHYELGVDVIGLAELTVMALA